jgi:formylglycine-generating enzyme required for sulfatase activity
MIGNVAEWVQDFAGNYPTSAVTDPQGPSTGTLRIVRGGGFQSLISDGRVFVRVTKPAAAIDAIGFRCARSAAK